LLYTHEQKDIYVCVQFRVAGFPQLLKYVTKEDLPQNILPKKSKALYEELCNLKSMKKK